MSAREIAERLDNLADLINHITIPDHRTKPDQFHIDRNHCAVLARHIAKWVRSGHKPPELG